MFQNGPKRSQKCPKKVLKGPIRSQQSPKKVSKRFLEGPKGHHKGSQKGLKKVPKVSQNVPVVYKNGPKIAMEAQLPGSSYHAAKMALSEKCIYTLLLQATFYAKLYAK